MAVRLQKAFGESAEPWLGMQAAYDLSQVKNVKVVPYRKASWQALGRMNNAPHSVAGIDSENGYDSRCGATMSMNSREVITLVCFQNFGKWRVLPVTR